MTSDVRVWLLRVGGQICGPFDDSEVNSLILSQQISEVDEITLPCRPWSYIRDQALFQDAFEKLQSKSFVKPSNTVSLTATSDVTIPSSFDRTEEVNATSDLTGTQKLIDLGRSDPLSPRLQKTLDIDALKQEGRVYIKSDSKLKRNKIFLLVAVVFIFVSLFYFFFQDYKVRGRGEDFSLYWAAGNYKEALKSLRARGALEQDKPQIKEAALLILNSEGTFTTAERVMALSSQKESPEWKNLQGILYLHAGQMNEAEGRFVTSLKENPNYSPAFINLGLVKRAESKWSEARYYFEAAFSNSQDSGSNEAGFYLAESWAKKLLQEEGMQSLEDVKTFIKNQVIAAHLFNHELLFFMAWLESLDYRTKREKIEKILNPLLTQDPTVLFERARSPYVYRIPKGSLSYICNDLERVLKGAPLKSSYLALCHFMDGDLERAERDFAYPGLKGVGLALKGFILKFQNKEMESEEALVEAMTSTSNENWLRYYLQARFCEEKGDLKCAANYWQEILRYDPGSYVAQTGLARSYFKFGDLENAQKFFTRAWKITKSYGPLIELKYRLEKAREK